MPRYVNPTNRAAILPTYQRLGNAVAVARELQLSASLVRNVVNAAGAKNPHAQRRYNFNDRYFRVIDSPAKAYFLGLIAADGCVHVDSNWGTRIIKIQLVEEDSYILEDFKRQLGASNPLYLLINKPPRRNVSALSLTSREMFEDLHNLGICERKSGALSFPRDDQVPPSLLPHFVRGYFDGDGSVFYVAREYRLCIGFCGTIAFLEGLREFLCKRGLCIESSLQKRRDNSFDAYQLSFKGLRRGREFYEIIYRDASQWLTRKRAIFDKHLFNYALF